LSDHAAKRSSACGAMLTLASARVGLLLRAQRPAPGDQWASSARELRRLHPLFAAHLRDLALLLFPPCQVGRNNAERRNKWVGLMLRPRMAAILAAAFRAGIQPSGPLRTRGCCSSCFAGWGQESRRLSRRMASRRSSMPQANENRMCPLAPNAAPGTSATSASDRIHSASSVSFPSP